MTGSAAGLPRGARLTGKAQFDRVFAARTARNSRYFRLNLADNGLEHARLGMAVSRRVDKRAVQRNRLRRQIRESFRLAWPGLPALDIVVTARPDAAQAARALVWADLLALWAALAQR
jgi:ribonuclease P protein component